MLIIIWRLIIFLMLTLQVLIYTLIISVCLAEPLIRDIVVNRLSAYDIPSIPLFKGIIKGNLSPYCYTRFLNQDSFYLDSSTARWDAARKMASADPEFQ